MTKFNLRLKSLSVSTSASPVDGDPSEPKKPQRTPKRYLVSLRDNRFFSLRKRRSIEGELLQVDRIPSPKSLPGRSRLASPKTPQIASLFSSQAVRSESNRHHRQYAVSLSNFPQLRNFMMEHRDRGTTVDQESPSVSRLKRLNSQKQRVASAPMNLGVVPTRSGEDLRGGVILLEQGTISSVSQSIIPIPSLILHTPTSGSGGTQEPDKDTDVPSDVHSEQTISTERPSTGEKHTGLRRSVGILQEVAKRMRAEQEYSQWSLFWFLVFPAVIMASMATFAFAPEASTFFGVNNPLPIPCIVAVAVAVALRWVLWIMASMFQSFCEMDIDVLFREDGIVDQNGMRVAQADIVKGIFG